MAQSVPFRWPLPPSSSDGLEHLPLGDILQRLVALCPEKAVALRTLALQALRDEIASIRFGASNRFGPR